jgi:HlyD family secretion protein
MTRRPGNPWQREEGRPRETVGLQGLALIQELQRIQGGFDREFPAEQRPAGSGRGRAPEERKLRPPPAKGARAAGAKPAKAAGKPLVRSAAAVGGRVAPRYASQGGGQRSAAAPREPMEGPRVRVPEAPRMRAPEATQMRAPETPQMPAREAPQMRALAEAPRKREAGRMPQSRAIAVRPQPAQGRQFALPEPARVPARQDRTGGTWLAPVNPGGELRLHGRHERPAKERYRTEPVTRVGRSVGRRLRTGLRVLVIGFGLVGGGWAGFVPLSGGVLVMSGTLVAETDVKTVQHPTGGMVAAIPARDGMRVNAGDLLVRLDDSSARTNLQVLTKQLDETRIRLARLVAERDNAADIEIPPAVAQRAGNSGLDQLLQSEKALFKSRVGARQGQKELLQSRVNQLNEEITGLTAQIKSKGDQIDLVKSELQGVQSLYDKRLVPLTRLTALQRDAARLEGERSQAMSALAETQSKVSEVELAIQKIDNDFRGELAKDVREAEGKESELSGRAVAAQDALNRAEVRAPAAGTVTQSAVNAVGGVVGPADVLMVIVPDSYDLQIEARLPSNEIDQVHTGQDTLVRLPALNAQIRGQVSLVSADPTRDEPTNRSFYTVRVKLPAEELRRLGNMQLTPGMPAEVSVQAGRRTMLSQLLTPLAEQFNRLLNERAGRAS